MVDPAEESFDLEYYRSLSNAQRFRMLIDRSVLLLMLARRNEIDRDSSPLAKRS